MNGHIYSVITHGILFGNSINYSPENCKSIRNWMSCFVCRYLCNEHSVSVVSVSNLNHHHNKSIQGTVSGAKSSWLGLNQLKCERRYSGAINCIQLHPFSSANWPRINLPNSIDLYQFTSNRKELEKKTRENRNNILKPFSANPILAWTKVCGMQTGGPYLKDCLVYTIWITPKAKWRTQ